MTSSREDAIKYGLHKAARVALGVALEGEDDDGR